MGDEPANDDDIRHAGLLGRIKPFARFLCGCDVEKVLPLRYRLGAGLITIVVGGLFIAPAVAQTHSSPWIVLASAAVIFGASAVLLRKLFPQTPVTVDRMTGLSDDSKSSRTWVACAIGLLVLGVSLFLVGRPGAMNDRPDFYISLDGMGYALSPLAVMAGMSWLAIIVLRSGRQG